MIFPFLEYEILGGLLYFRGCFEGRVKVALSYI